jgi:hypothetical protein
MLDSIDAPSEGELAMAISALVDEAAGSDGRK